MTQVEMRRLLKSTGMTAADIRHCQDLAALCEVLGEDRIVPMVIEEGIQAYDRATRRAVRSLLATVSAQGPRRQP